MKKIIFPLTMFCICFSSYSQEMKKVTNEIKLNLLTAVMSLPEISYERVWENNIGAGIAVGCALGDYNNDIKYQVLPYGRFYFGESQKKALFIEGNLGAIGRKSYLFDIAYNEEYDYFYSYIVGSKTNTSLGIGLSVGYKYINKKGFIGELFLGAGRTFGNYNLGYPRIGISIGKQF